MKNKKKKPVAGTVCKDELTPCQSSTQGSRSDSENEIKKKDDNNDPSSVKPKRSKAPNHTDISSMAFSKSTVSSRNKLVKRSSSVSTEKSKRDYSPKRWNSPRMRGGRWQRADTKRIISSNSIANKETKYDHGSQAASTNVSRRSRSTTIGGYNSRDVSPGYTSLELSPAESHSEVTPTNLNNVGDIGNRWRKNKNRPCRFKGRQYDTDNDIVCSSERDSSCGSQNRDEILGQKIKSSNGLRLGKSRGRQKKNKSKPSLLPGNDFGGLETVASKKKLWEGRIKDENEVERKDLRITHKVKSERQQPQPEYTAHSPSTKPFVQKQKVTHQTSMSTDSSWTSKPNGEKRELSLIKERLDKVSDYLPLSGEGQAMGIMKISEKSHKDGADFRHSHTSALVENRPERTNMGHAQSGPTESREKGLETSARPERRTTSENITTTGSDQQAPNLQTEMELKKAKTCACTTGKEPIAYMASFHPSSRGEYAGESLSHGNYQQVDAVRKDHASTCIDQTVEQHIIYNLPKDIMGNTTKPSGNSAPSLGDTLLDCELQKHAYRESLNENLPKPRETRLRAVLSQHLQDVAEFQHQLSRSMRKLMGELDQIEAALATGKNGTIFHNDGRLSLGVRDSDKIGESEPGMGHTATVGSVNRHGACRNETSPSGRSLHYDNCNLAPNDHRNGNFLHHPSHRSNVKEYGDLRHITKSYGLIGNKTSVGEDRFWPTPPMLMLHEAQPISTQTADRAATHTYDFHCSYPSRDGFSHGFKGNAPQANTIVGNRLANLLREMEVWKRNLRMVDDDEEVSKRKHMASHARGRYGVPGYLTMTSIQPPFERSIVQGQGYRHHAPVTPSRMYPYARKRRRFARLPKGAVTDRGDCCTVTQAGDHRSVAIEVPMKPRDAACTSDTDEKYMYMQYYLLLLSMLVQFSAQMAISYFQ